MGSTSWADLSRHTAHRERGLLLLERGADLSDEDYWSAVADTWHYSDPQPLTAEQWRRLWLADRPGRGLVMTAGEREALVALPERVTVHRGVNFWNDAGGISWMSWTRDRDTAHRVALRVPGYEDRGWVISGTVLRHRILALFHGRREWEIVVEPEHVRERSWDRAEPDHLRNR